MAVVTYGYQVIEPAGTAPMLYRQHVVNLHPTGFPLISPAVDANVPVVRNNQRNVLGSISDDHTMNFVAKVSAGWRGVFAHLPAFDSHPTPAGAKVMESGKRYICQ